MCRHVTREIMSFSNDDMCQLVQKWFFVSWDEKSIYQLVPRARMLFYILEKHHYNIWIVDMIYDSTYMCLPLEYLYSLDGLQLSLTRLRDA